MPDFSGLHPGYFPAPDRVIADPLIRDVPQRDASQGLTVSWSQEPVRRRAAAGFDVEASLWRCVNVTLASIGPQLQI